MKVLLVDQIAKVNYKYALFNEVALSPNSCALYFIELAYCDSSTKCDKKGTSK